MLHIINFYPEILDIVSLLITWSKILFFKWHNPFFLRSHKIESFIYYQLIISIIFMPVWYFGGGIIFSKNKYFELKLGLEEKFQRLFLSFAFLNIVMKTFYPCNYSVSRFCGIKITVTDQYCLFYIRDRGVDGKSLLISLCGYLHLYVCTILHLLSIQIDIYRRDLKGKIQVLNNVLIILFYKHS